MLDVAIAGDGVTGLADAISLRRSGHWVTIYERSSLSNEIGAAINVPPNVGRFLLLWGLDSVCSRFVFSKDVYFLSPKTLEELSYHDHSQSAEKLGAPLLYAHRVDLHESLKHMATEPDGLGILVTVHLKSGDPDTLSITLCLGTVVIADLVIVADRVHSMAGEAIIGVANTPQPGLHYNCAYRFLIPRSDLEDDPKTKIFNQGHQQLGCRLIPDPQNRRRLFTYTCWEYVSPLNIKNRSLLKKVSEACEQP